jgi:tetratricopeptide (TPR) repeat protein
MSTVKGKNLQFALISLSLLVLLAGCATYKVSGEVQRGRMELLYGDPNVALAHFQEAAELNPNYRLNYSLFPEGVWTYVGRANLAAGRIPEARKALERARTREDDDLAKVYLGLVLARSGDYDRGLKEIEAGLRGINEWYDYIQFYHLEGQYWDPGRCLRSSIQQELRSLSSPERTANETVQNVAFLGREIELEIDRARDHKDLYWQRRFHGDEMRR